MTKNLLLSVCVGKGVGTMPHYNIEHNSKYYVFTSVSDCIIAEFETFDELQKHRIEKFGLSAFENEKTFSELNANKMELKETIIPQIMSRNETTENIIKYFNLLNDVEKAEVFKDLIDVYYEKE